MENFKTYFWCVIMFTNKKADTALYPYIHTYILTHTYTPPHTHIYIFIY